MRVLLDNGVPRGVTAALSGHAVAEARAHGWDTLKNGDLLNAAEAAGFEVFLTTDRHLRDEQNLTGRRIAIIVLTKASWPRIKPLLPTITTAVAAAEPGRLVEVEIGPAPQSNRRASKPRGSG